MREMGTGINSGLWGGPHREVNNSNTIGIPSSWRLAATHRRTVSRYRDGLYNIAWTASLFTAFSKTGRDNKS